MLIMCQSLIGAQKYMHFAFTVSFIYEKNQYNIFNMRNKIRTDMCKMCTCK